MGTTKDAGPNSQTDRPVLVNDGTLPLAPGPRPGFTSDPPGIPMGGGSGGSGDGSSSGGTVYRLLYLRVLSGAGLKRGAKTPSGTNVFAIRKDGGGGPPVYIEAELSPHTAARRRRRVPRGQMDRRRARPGTAPWNAASPTRRPASSPSPAPSAGSPRR